MIDRLPALAHLLHALDAVDDEMRYLVEPGGEGWVRASALDGPALDAMAATVLADGAAGRRDVAGSYCASWTAAALAGTAAIPLVLWRRTWAVEPRRITLHADPEGWYDAIAVDAPMRVLLGDPAAGAPGVEVLTDITAMRHDWARETADVLTPLFAHLAERLRFGLPAMWGSVADAVAGHCLWVGNEIGADPDAVWDGATALVDVLAAEVPALRTRPRRHAVPWSGGVRHMSVRGTCCLHYRTVADPDPDGEGYCSSCPLRTDGSRERRMAAFLESRDHAA